MTTTQKKFSRLRCISGLIALLPALLILLIGRSSENSLWILLPWIGAPLLGLALFWLWLPHALLPAAPPDLAPSSLLADGVFAVSGAQFFPVRDDYTEAPPRPPVRSRFIRAWLLAGMALLLGVAGCVVPFYCVWASFLAITLACINPAGFASSGDNRPVPIQRLTLAAFCFGLAGVWSCVVIVVAAL